MDKPIIRVIIWDMDKYPAVVAQKNFRTFKAAENFASKWGNKTGNYDPEVCWNEAANKLLK